MINLKFYLEQNDFDSTVIDLCEKSAYKFD